MLLLTGRNFLNRKFRIKAVPLWSQRYRLPYAHGDIEIDDYFYNVDFVVFVIFRA